MISTGEQIGRYRIRSAIGKGGMGEVFLAEDTELERLIALKILPKDLANDTERMRRFVQEAKSASALNHPNIITIYEIGKTDDTHFIATEYIEGETLHSRLRNESMNLKTVLDIAIQVASALDAAHRAGIVHRDIKPENVMIRPDGFIKLLDFGIAKLTEKQSEISPDSEGATAIKAGTMPGMIIGTANYMSPEQARGQAVDARTDIFSFGVMLYEMLSGKLPFEGQNALDVIGLILHKEFAPLIQTAPDAPRELKHIVEKCLRKDRDERFQTARDLLIDLKDVRRELEFQNELERTGAPHQEESKTQIQNPTTSDTATLTSSTENVAGDIKRHKLGFVIGLSILLLAAIGFGYWFYANRLASIDARQISSIAVLPFENGSGDAALDYLSDGLSESLIDKLSQLPQLKVIARSSSFKYRGANVDVTEAANKLGVQAIVTGRIIQRGDNLSIRVEMVDVRDNRQLWSEQYNRKTADAFAVQQEVAQTVSEQLHLKLSGAQEQKLAKRDMVNPQAYDLLLKGRFQSRKGGTDNIKKASEYYQQAIAIDPNYALAYVYLAGSYRGLVGHSVLDPKEFLPKANAAARKALELDPNLPETHLAMGNLYHNDWNWAAAETEFKRAIELNPNLVAARNTYSTYLSIMGRHDEAIVEARHTKELDPLTLGNLVAVGYALGQARRYDEAIAEYKKILEVDKNYFGARYWLSYAYLDKGMYREAIDSFQEAIRLGGNNPSNQIYLGASYAKAGEREKAQAILKQLETSKEYVSPGELPVLYVALGEREKAFASFEKAYAAHDSQLQFLKVDPSFDPLRDDPRFQDLMRRVGLPQ
jgi:serine/threonine-protein kinase